MWGYFKKMPNRIQLLTEKVANQIAAGEVIQRPASAVKELLENAIDAGATKINLVVKDAGRTLIQVIDNGCGMNAADARLCFARHSTSKLSKFEDLDLLQTKGFRGEALASIASIAQIELKTRTNEDEVGTLIELEGGVILSESVCSCAIGTSISVKNLFFNVPARRRFLKTDNSELKQIIDEFERLAIPHASIGFSLIHNDQVIYQLEPNNLKGRLLKIFGSNYDERLVPVEEHTDLVSLYGYIGKPAFTKKTRGEQFFFVNNRFIRSPYLNNAINLAFRELIPKENHPSYFIFFELDPAKIDINIHPTKTEVKFDDEQAIYAYLLSAVKMSLGKYNLTPLLDFSQDPVLAHVPVGPSNKIPSAPQVLVNTNFNPFEKQPGSYKREKEHIEEWSNLLNHIQAYQIPQPAPAIQPELVFNEEQQSSGQKVFQLHGQYILAQVKSGLLLIDQKGAYERILYEKFLSQAGEQNFGTQKILFPVELRLGAQDNLIAQGNLDLFQTFGVDIIDKGNGLFSIEGMPSDCLDSGEKEIVESLLESIKQTETLDLNGRRTKLALALCQKGKIKNGTLLNESEMRGLINQLFRCKQPSFSPDNRQIVVVLDLNQIATIISTIKK